MDGEAGEAAGALAGIGGIIGMVPDVDGTVAGVVSGAGAIVFPEGCCATGRGS